jgi:hypothetical protein
MLDTVTIKEFGKLAVVFGGFATIAFIGYRLLFAEKTRSRAKMHVESACYKISISGVNSGVVCIILASIILVVWLLTE